MARQLPYTFKLRKPIETGQFDKEKNPIVLNELTFKREPTGYDIEGFNLTNPTTQTFLRIASKMLDIEYPILRKMHGADAFELMGVISDFLAPE